MSIIGSAIIKELIDWNKSLIVVYLGDHTGASDNSAICWFINKLARLFGKTTVMFSKCPLVLVKRSFAIMLRNEDVIF